VNNTHKGDGGKVKERNRVLDDGGKCYATRLKSFPSTNIRDFFMNPPALHPSKVLLCADFRIANENVVQMSS
jgi:hypothetical protein